MCVCDISVWVVFFCISTRDKEMFGLSLNALMHLATVISTQTKTLKFSIEISDYLLYMHRTLSLIFYCLYVDLFQMVFPKDKAYRSWKEATSSREWAWSILDSWFWESSQWLFAFRWVWNTSSFRSSAKTRCLSARAKLVNFHVTILFVCFVICSAWRRYGQTLSYTSIGWGWIFHCTPHNIQVIERKNDSVPRN